MATLEQDEANILDAETFNWRVVVYPLLIVFIIVTGGFGIFYYQQSVRDQNEAAARALLLKAKTPEEWSKVADQYPTTTQAVLALMAAGEFSFAKQDFTGAAADYQRILKIDSLNPELRESAQLGLASSQEAAGKPADAINTYLEVAHRGTKSPFAPFAYSAVARLYEESGKVENQRETLSQLATLDPDSSFVRDAQAKLKELNAATTPMVPASAAPSASSAQVTELPATTAAPTPAKAPGAK